MAAPRLGNRSALRPLLGPHSFVRGAVAWHSRPVSSTLLSRFLSTTSRRLEQQQPQQKQSSTPTESSSDSTSSATSTQPTTSAADSEHFSLPPGWEDNPSFDNVTGFADLPHRFFGYNQHIKINEDFKESLRQILWQFRAPIRYAFAYGSGVFSQSGSGGSSITGDLSPHPNPPKAVEEWQKGGAKIIDFIFGVSHTQHWHSLNLTQHPDHYSFLKYLPYSSAAISRVQDSFGAGVYFNPFITVNGVMIKYGVVNLDTLHNDLTDWSTLYLAGRLQKPVKILRDDARIRMANQLNLISALRTALLMLPERFTERQLYERIAGLSYMGDPRMMHIPGLGAGENLSKVSNIVGAQLPGFRQLYVPLIENLPNIQFTDSRTPRDAAWEKEDAIRHTGSNITLAPDVLGGRDGLELTQDCDPKRRGNMVRRLPNHFRRKLYYQYSKKFGIPGSAFDEAGLDPSGREAQKEGEAASKREGGDFEQRVAGDTDLQKIVADCVNKTVAWPATSQTIKSFFTAGVGKAWRYYGEKRKKSRKPEKKEEKEEKVTDEKDQKEDKKD